MDLNLFDYYLPKSSIAQTPQKPRDHSRLMVLDRKKKSWQLLVSAFAGRKFILNSYKEAVKKKYRFYSFGDGMLIE